MRSCLVVVAAVVAFVSTTPLRSQQVFRTGIQYVAVEAAAKPCSTRSCR